jgi:hypothetical protein
LVIFLPYFEDIYFKDFPGGTLHVLKEKEEGMRRIPYKMPRFGGVG